MGRLYSQDLCERVVDAAGIGRLIGTITPDECANFSVAAGYEPN